MRTDPFFEAVLTTDKKEPAGADNPEILEPEINPQLDDSLFPSIAYRREPVIDPFIQDPSTYDPTPPEESPAPPPDPKKQALMALAKKVAPATVILRAWDRFGTQLSSGAGFLVSENGLLLTDAGLIHPQFSSEIEYITVRSGFGKQWVVTGCAYRDLQTGLAVLKVNNKEPTPYLELNPDAPLKQKQDVLVVGLDSKRGMSLNDATMRPDETRAGAGWLIITGDDRAGAVGSPVFNRNGQVIALVAMEVKMENWRNYAAPIRPAWNILGGKSPNELELPALPKIKDLSTFQKSDLAKDSDFLEAVQSLLDRKFREANRKLLPLSAKYPRSPEIWALLGITFLRLNQADEALACHFRSASLDPTVSIYWNNLGALSRMAQGSQENLAADTYAARLKANPGDQNAALGVAAQEINIGEYQIAIDRLEKIIQHAKPLPRAEYLLAVAHSKIGQLPQAVQYLQSYLGKSPEDAEGWFLLGLIFQNNKQLDDAVNAYEKAAALAPNSSQIYMNLSHVYLLQGRRNQALDARKKAASLKP